MIAFLLIAICVAGMALAVLVVTAVLIYEEKHGMFSKEYEEFDWNL
jgi:hypothetical protein